MIKVREQVHDMLGPSSYDTEQAVQPFLERYTGHYSTLSVHLGYTSQYTQVLRVHLTVHSS